MAEWWVAPLVTVIVAIVGTSGVWLTVLVTKRSSDRQYLAEQLRGYREEVAALRTRMDVVLGRNVKLTNYAQGLRDQIYEMGGKPAEWPEDLYD